MANKLNINYTFQKYTYFDDIFCLNSDVSTISILTANEYDYWDFRVYLSDSRQYSHFFFKDWELIDQQSMEKIVWKV